MINKPEPTEYGTFHLTYISKVPDGDVLAHLEQQKKNTTELFINLSEAKANYAYADGKWTMKEILGHLIDQERIFGYRALAFSREPVELPGYDQDLYVLNAGANGRSMADLVTEYRALREANLCLFRTFTHQQLLRKGRASGYSISVRAAIYIIAGHELHHLGIIKEKYL